jgi:hypothetical protein
LSTLLYLHELGHQLDTWSVFSGDVRTDEKTVTCNFSGDTAKKMHDKWLEIIGRLSVALRKKYYTQYFYECEYVKHIYHGIHGKTGNPWEPNSIVHLADKEKAEDDKTLAEAETELAKAEIMLAEVEAELAELMNHKSEKTTAEKRLIDAKRRLEGANNKLNDAKRRLSELR